MWPRVSTPNVSLLGGCSSPDRFDGPLTIDTITQQIAAEGVRRMVVVSDEPEKDDIYALGVTANDLHAETRDDGR